jgi:hypothetical protein
VAETARLADAPGLSDATRALLAVSLKSPHFAQESLSDRTRTDLIAALATDAQGAEDEVCSARRIKFERWLSLFR